MKTTSSIKDMITECVSQAFLEVISKDLDEECTKAHARVSEIFAKAHRDAGLAANKMALELFHKMDNGSISIEWKPK